MYNELIIVFLNNIKLIILFLSQINILNLLPNNLQNQL